MTQVSIIIPCFNDGKYLPETVASASAQTHAQTEIVIVDDHSTDSLTLSVLDDLRRQGFTVARTPVGKKGVAAARNAGILIASGDYILPLDADDIIDPTYVAKASAVLDANPGVGICYCQARFFGFKRKPWKLPEYSLERILLQNIIFVSAMYRREHWQSVGGYCELLECCNEDHLFWLSLLKCGVDVFQIPEILFYYRIRSNSRSSQNFKDFASVQKCLFLYHKEFYIQNIDLLYDMCCSLYYEKEQREKLFTWRIVAPLFGAELKIFRFFKSLLGR